MFVSLAHESLDSTHMNFILWINSMKQVVGRCMSIIVGIRIPFTLRQLGFSYITWSFQMSSFVVVRKYLQWILFYKDRRSQAEIEHLTWPNCTKKCLIQIQVTPFSSRKADLWRQLEQRYIHLNKWYRVDTSNRINSLLCKWIVIKLGIHYH